MSAQYDGIADAYKRTKESPLRRHVEAFTFLNLLGDMQGKRVLDLACGEGFYTRRIRNAGAAYVMGVDISPEMIELARAEEDRNPLDIEYFCEDVAVLSALGQFDLVSAAYLLHYASDEAALRKMCRNIATQLLPGGRLVCINENPEQPEANYASYGFDKQMPSPRDNGSTIRYAMISGGELINFDAYYYSKDVYESALRDAGFTKICWSPLQLSPAGIAECGEDYWRIYMANPPVTGLECRL